MTSIKPPDGKPPAGVPAAGDATDGPTETEGVGPSFQEVLEGGPSGAAAGAEGAAAAPEASGAAAADPIAELAEAVRSGALSADQAIDQLVERAAGQMSAQLSEAQRAELVAVLREAVESDPALRALRDSV
ncbi:MAG: hypothetical protein OXT09_31945 [Myxococcales bacterium]|nr:hypothetical protein [Myxococcales bacterium]